MAFQTLSLSGGKANAGIPVDGIPASGGQRLGELAGVLRAVGLGCVDDEVGCLLSGQVGLAEDLLGDLGAGFAAGQLLADQLGLLGGHLR